jgi:hypothetical protein
MIGQRLERSEREAFGAAAERLGRTPAALEQRLVAADDAAPAAATPRLDAVLAAVDADRLRRAGRLELWGWLRWLPRRERNRLQPLVAAHLGRRPRLGRRPERLAPAAVESLQVCLFAPLPETIDLGLRAGLHRLARALADVEPDAFEAAVASLPRAWCLGLRLARSRLAREESAAALRGRWEREVAS